MVRIKHPHLGTNKHILLPTMFMVSWTQAVWKEGASAETSQLYTPAASNSRLVRATWVALLSLFCNKEPTPRFSQPCIGGCFFPDGFARVTTPPFHRVLFLAAFLKLGGTEVSFGKGYTGNSFGGCVYSWRGCSLQNKGFGRSKIVLQRALFFLCFPFFFFFFCNILKEIFYLFTWKYVVACEDFFWYIRLFKNIYRNSELFPNICRIDRLIIFVPKC